MSASSTVRIAIPGGAFDAYLALPAGQPKAGIVILQEIFGINANIRGVADWFAGEGYAAIAPDLFWRSQPGVELSPASDADREQATALMKATDTMRARDDAAAAADLLRTRLGHGARVAAAGYCFGGKLAFLLAATPKVDAAISYYGVAIQASLDKMPDVVCPLLLHIAADDHLGPPDAQQAIADAAAANALVEVMAYPGVGHAFARRGAAVYDAQSATRADDATLRFLERHLAP